MQKESVYVVVVTEVVVDVRVVNGRKKRFKAPLDRRADDG
jgi:hypothetical protein